MKRLTLALFTAVLITAAGNASSWWGGWNPYDPWDPRYWAEEFFGGGWGGYGGGPWGYGGGPWGYGGPWGGYYGGPWGGYGGYPHYGGHGYGAYPYYAGGYWPYAGNWGYRPYVAGTTTKPAKAKSQKKSGT